MSQVLLFDGVCNLCEGAVQFVLAHERAGSTLQFASLQSPAGTRLLQEAGLNATYIDSLVYLENGKAFTHSDAALGVAKHLKAPFVWVRIFHFLPKGFRDWVYNGIAKNRYRWFGQKQECWLPTPALKSRFL